MSVIITATYQGETFDVEIFHDGHDVDIEFPGRSLQHEQAMAEFTDSESVVLQFYNDFCEKPIENIFKRLWCVAESRSLLAADYAEHVLYLYEGQNPDDIRPRKAIEAVWKFNSGQMTLSVLKRAASAARAAAWKAARAAEPAAWAAVRAAEAAAEEAAEPAAWAAVRAAWTKVRVKVRAARVKALNEVRWAAQWAGSPAAKARAGAAEAAARAAGWNASEDNHSLEWHQARGEEITWQIRRFVDVMEALGQGLDWPDMKVTP
jgi:hypothetical protein